MLALVCSFLDTLIVSRGVPTISSKVVLLMIQYPTQNPLACDERAMFDQTN